jgi:hypothetical protein
MVACALDEGALESAVWSSRGGHAVSESKWFTERCTYVFRGGENLNG